MMVAHFSSTEFPVHLTTRNIEDIIPHRQPIRLVDSLGIFQADPLSSSVAAGFCDLSEKPHLFAGHFPCRPILPGIYLTEFMAQSAAAFFLFLHPELIGQDFGLWEANIKFRQPVGPEVKVIYSGVKILHIRRNFVRFDVKSAYQYPNDLKSSQLFAEGEITGVAMPKSEPT